MTSIAAASPTATSSVDHVSGADRSQRDGVSSEQRSLPSAWPLRPLPLTLAAAVAQARARSSGSAPRPKSGDLGGDSQEDKKKIQVTGELQSSLPRCERQAPR